MRAAKLACMVNVFIAILCHKWVAFELLTLTCYTPTAARYHMVSLERHLSFSYSYYYCSSHLVIIVYTLFDGRYGQLDVRSRVRFIPVKHIGNDVSQGIVAIKPCLLRS